MCKIYTCSDSPKGGWGLYRDPSFFDVVIRPFDMVVLSILPPSLL